jgi:NAD(P)-dependent dehydrogenase (short-subunit alcohol dehydrogenase family)
MKLGTVLVTGGSSGLGLAVCTAVAATGGQAIALDRQPLPAVQAGGDTSLDPGAVEGRAVEGGAVEGAVDHVLVDLADTAAAERAVEDAALRHGGLDAVVTAAGIDRCGALDEVPAADWELVVRVNLLATAAVVRAALSHLRRSNGRVVTVASTLGLRALPHATAYCASKFGVVGFTRALAAETAGEIGVTLLIPGGMRTAFFDDRPQRYRPGPDARLNAPQDVAAAVLFALSQPAGCELRELTVCPSTEPSWP